MKANEFKMMRRKNLGNYEHEEVTISMTVEDDDSLDEVISFCQVKVAEALGLQPKVENIKEVIEGGNVTTKAGTTVDAGTGKKVAKKVAKKARVKKEATKKAAKDVPVSTPKEEKPKYSIDEVKGKLAQVWKAKGKSIAIDILKDFKVARTEELKATDYNDVVERAESCLM